MNEIYKLYIKLNKRQWGQKKKIQNKTEQNKTKQTKQTNKIKQNETKTKKQAKVKCNALLNDLIFCKHR